MKCSLAYLVLGIEPCVVVNEVVNDLFMAEESRPQERSHAVGLLVAGISAPFKKLRHDVAELIPGGPDERIRLVLVLKSHICKRINQQISNFDLGHSNRIQESRLACCILHIEICLILDQLDDGIFVTEICREYSRCGTCICIDLI